MSEESQRVRGRKKTLTETELKRNRQAASSAYNKTRISLGDECERWNDLKRVLGLQSHSEVAKYLLDRYDNRDNTCTSAKRMNCTFVHTSTQTDFGFTSTPQHQPILPDLCFSCSDLEQDNNQSESTMTGVENVGEENLNEISSDSFINPFQLSMGLSEHQFLDEDDDISSDEDYEPSCYFSFRKNLTAGQYCSLDTEDEEWESDDEVGVDFQQEIDLGHAIQQIKTEADISNFTESQVYLVYTEQLLCLAKTNIQECCNISGCTMKVEIVQEVIGSATYLKWVCSSGHVIHTWCSQPLLNRRMHAGDLAIASAILMSGSNYQKIVLLSKFLKMPIPSRTTFFKIQRTYLIPSVKDFWIKHQDDLLNQYTGQDVIVMGDGRMDSPGHCAQYCTYTFMEYVSKTILCIITMDKRECENKSTNLEKACFQKGLRFLLERNIRIVEVVTDAHVQVASLMKKNYPNIKHSFDIWHGAKNLGKKIIKAGQDKAKKDLLQWTQDIVNHYWHTAQVANSKDEFMGIWIGVLHHVINKHEWLLPYGSTTSACSHEPLSDDRNKTWLKQDSPAHVALRNIVLDKRLINKIPYYVNCRSTAELETFQNLILMYASKRHSYRPPTFHCRNLLAALDNNIHIDRQMMMNKDGSARYQRAYNKKTSRWLVHQLKCEKTYTHIPIIMEEVIKKRLADNIGMNQRVVLEAGDPRLLSAHLAPIPPPPTHQIVAEQRSRFQ